MEQVSFLMPLVKMVPILTNSRPSKAPRRFVLRSRTGVNMAQVLAIPGNLKGVPE